MIQNPTPFELTASGLWITSLDVTRERFVASGVMPWDGTANKLAGNPTDAREITVANAPIIAALFSEIGRVAGRDPADVRFLRISAADPARPVIAEAGIRGLPQAVSIESISPRIVADGIDVVVMANGQQHVMRFAAMPADLPAAVRSILETQASVKADAEGEVASWRTDDLFALVASDPELTVALGAVYAFVSAEVN